MFTFPKYIKAKYNSQLILIKMKHKQTKQSFFHHHSLPPDTKTRINSLQKLLDFPDSPKLKTSQLQIKQQLSAVRQLLNLRDETSEEWVENCSLKENVFRRNNNTGASSRFLNSLLINNRPWKNCIKEQRAQDHSHDREESRTPIFCRTFNMRKSHNIHQSPARATSHLGLVRKSSLSYDQGNQQMQEGQMRTNKNSIKILPNKATTVRQMLCKLKTNGSSNLALQLQKDWPSRSTTAKQSSPHRHPFDPYSSKKSQRHYKNFTSFKMLEEKRQEQSLLKLQKHLEQNQYESGDINQMEMKFLERPAYCAWVERNKDKLKVKVRKQQPPTLRPIKNFNN